MENAQNVKKELSFGERAVGLKFNPSNDDKIGLIKNNILKQLIS